MRRPPSLGAVRLSLLLLLCGVSVGCGAVSGAGWSPETLPNPWNDPEQCGRPSGVEHSWLCDPEHLIGTNEQNVIEGIVKAIADGEKPFGRMECGSLGKVGAQVAVAIIDVMSSDFMRLRSKEARAAAFAKQLHDKWGVGHAECNNGVVLFLSIKDRQVFISTGAGVKSRLTDSRVLDIIRELKPFLRANQYGQAVVIAVEGIGEMVAKHPSNDLWIVVLFFSLIGGLMFYGARNQRRQRQEYSVVKVHLNRIQEAQERAKHDVYQATSCPICLEDFTAAPEEPTASPIPEATTNGGDPPSVVGGSQIRSRNGSGVSPTASCPSEERPLLDTEAAGSSSSNNGSKSEHRVETGQAKTGAGETPIVREPVALSCGHVFCEPCIDEWMKQHHTCPICRKAPNAGGGGGGGPPDGGSDDGDDRDGGPSQPSAPSTGACASGVPPPSGARYSRWMPMGRQMRRGAFDVGPELAFRLGSLHRRYPRYVSRHMVDRWSYDIMHGRHFAWRTDTDFTRVDPARVERMQSSGSRGMTRDRKSVV